jgi:hypothetical protein
MFKYRVRNNVVDEAVTNFPPSRIMYSIVISVGQTPQCATVQEHHRNAASATIASRKNNSATQNIQQEILLKRQSQEIFDFWFFHKSTAPRLINTLKYSRIPLRIRGDTRTKTVEKSNPRYAT